MCKTNSCLALYSSKTKTYFLNTYVNPKDIRSSHLQKSLEDLNLDRSDKILLMGDLNAIDLDDYTHDIPKTNDIRVLRHKKLNSLFSSLLLNDIAKMLHTPLPTHFDKRTQKWSRIDYVFSNLEGIDPNSYAVDIIRNSNSDHQGLHLWRKTDWNHYTQSRWKLNDQILGNYIEINDLLNKLSLQGSWGHKSENYDLFKSRLRDALRAKCVKLLADRKLMKNALEFQISKTESKLYQSKNHSDNKNLIKKLNDKKVKLNEIKTKEAEWHARSIKDFFIEINEGNPEMTKRMINSLKSKTDIKKIRNMSNEIIDDPDKILEEFKTFYENLYQETTSASPDIIEQKTKKYVERFLKQKAKSITKAKLLVQDESDDITEIEVEKAIMKLNSKSAPGSDGLTSSLYQSQKAFFIPFLTKLYNDIGEKHRVPPSFEQALIKIIPKNEKALEVNGDFRPISLINTDLKIFSHFITERVKKVMNIVIGQHQTAHLADRNVHTAIMKVQTYALEMSQQESIMALDFSKAFDCVARTYLMELVQHMPFSDFVKNMIKTIYNKNLAYIIINTNISEAFEIERGVRQGCPLSALLFNLSIEPLLQRIQRCKRIVSKREQKCVAYADDVSVCLVNRSIEKLLSLLSEFESISGLSINFTKSEILTTGKKTYTIRIKKVSNIKVLGVKINTKKNILPSIKTQLMEKCEIAPKLVSPAVSLRARARNFETFIMSKVIYQLRHYNNCKTFMKKINARLINYLWMNKKHCVNQEIVNTPPENCGIGLKNLNKAVITAKIMNLKFLAFSQPKQSFLEFFKQSKYFKYLEQELKKENVEIITLEPEFLKIQYFFQSFDITKETKSKQIYEILMKSIITIPCFAKVNMTAMKQNISPNIVMNFLETLWKNKKLMSFDKNHVYLFLMDSYMDKQDKWLKNLVPHPICFGCEAEFESWDHLLFKCARFERTRKALDIKSWRDIWTDQSGLAQKYLVSLILSSWTESIGQYLEYFLTHYKTYDKK